MSMHSLHTHTEAAAEALDAARPTAAADSSRSSIARYITLASHSYKLQNSDPVVETRGRDHAMTRDTKSQR